jgi:Methyltransferase domain
MYERTGRYYALFGPKAVVEEAETTFFRHWTQGRRKALDFGAGLCAPAMHLASLGLDVLAFEPSPVLAALALDRLSRAPPETGRVTLVEGDSAALSEPFAADLLLMRSVWMLLDDAQRAASLAALRRHAAPGAVLVMDARTDALTWAHDPGPHHEERRVGHTVYRRSTRYSRRTDGATGVHWTVTVERFGRTLEQAEESFVVRADTADGLSRELAAAGFRVERLYSAYDLARAYEPGQAMIVAAAVAV